MQVPNFRELTVYKKALLFRKAIYSVINDLPQCEQNNIGSILRRNSCSICANLAEGNSNLFYKKEFNHLNIALGKLAGIRSSMDIAHMEGYVNDELHQHLDQKAEEILRMIFAMMKRIDTILSEHKHKDNYGTKNIQPNIPHSELSSLQDKAVLLNQVIQDLSTQYPKQETTNIKDQITRASQSVLQNLKYSAKNTFSQITSNISVAVGSVSECSSFLDMSVMSGFITKSQYVETDQKCAEILKDMLKLLDQMEQTIEELTV